VRERERGERKGVERERESQHFDSGFSQNIPWKLEKFPTRKLFKIQFPTTFLSGKNSFEQRFES
jgi:hypothetical protein